MNIKQKFEILIELFSWRLREALISNIVIMQQLTEAVVQVFVSQECTLGPRQSVHRRQAVTPVETAEPSSCAGT